MHNGHINIIHEAVQKCAIDRVILMPTKPYYKVKPSFFSDEMKIKILQDFTQTTPYCEFSRYELDKAGDVYTADTVKYFHKKFPGKRICWIIGEDQLLQLEHWYRPDFLKKNVTFIVCQRSQQGISSSVEKVKKIGFDILWLDVPFLDISSTEIRKKIKNGQSIADLVPHSVIDNLPSEYLKDWIKADLSKVLSVKRYQHVERVAVKAKELAAFYNLDHRKAELAALLHDYCKDEVEFFTQKYQDLFRTLKKDADELLSIDKLIHAPLASFVAQYVYKIKDQEILDAIIFHPTGYKNLGEIGKIVYIADKIEEGRDYEGVDELRKLSKMNLDRTLLRQIEMLQRKGLPISQLTKEWYNKLKEGENGGNR